MRSIALLLISALGLSAQIITGGNGGGGGGGALPAGSLGCVQIYLTSTTFGCDTNLVDYPVATPAAFGMTGLQLGPAETDLSCCDGPANTASYNRQGGNIQINYTAAGSNANQLTSYYVSDGTLAAPTDWGGIKIAFQDYLAYESGSYQYVLDSFQQVKNTVGDFQWEVYALADSSREGGVELSGYTDGNIQFTFNHGQTPWIGISPVSLGVGEINQGVPVAEGGSLATINTQSISIAGSSFSFNGLTCTVVAGAISCT